MAPVERSRQLGTIGVMVIAIAVTLLVAILAVRAQRARTAPRVGADAIVAAGPEGRASDWPRSFLVPGVNVTITQGALTVHRSLPAASFGVEGDETLDRRLAPGPFDAIVEVVFRPDPAGRAFLGAQVRGGQVQLRVDGKSLLADAVGAEAMTTLTTLPVTLGRDLVTLTYELNRRGDEPFAFRAVWQPEASLVPLDLPVKGGALLDDLALRGRQTVGELGCAHCHESPDPARQAQLTRFAGPVLGDAGARLRPDWVRAWLREPSAVKPGTTMPALGLDRETIEDITHFLVSMGGPLADDGAAPDAAMIRTGEVLYHRVGCFACHGPLAPSPYAGTGEIASLYRSYAPLGPLAEKTSVTALAAYLQAPHDTHPDGRMPNLALSDLEARAIASYLVDHSGDRPGVVVTSSRVGFAVESARVTRGRAHFAEVGCANCHALGANRTQVVTQLTAPPLPSVAARPEAGCLGTGPAPPAPPAAQYALEDATRREVDAYLRELGSSPLAVDVPIDNLLIGLRTLNCTACHAFHGAAGPESAVAAYFETEGEADLGDEGRLPPHLSTAGARLTESWLIDVLEGEERARPYLAARMPEYGEHAVAGVVTGLLRAAGASAIDRVEPEFTIDHATAGRQLVGASAFNCIQCHTIAGHDATGTPGPDLALMPGRVHYETFARWLHDPGALRPGTRMPSFFLDGRGAFTDILGGLATAQIAAVWSYLSQGEALALPEGLIDATGYELVVSDEPIVFRTFMKDAGVRAIACGFPEQVHYAFDADRCELAVVWTGPFLSAQGAWGARGGAETNPRDVVWTPPKRPLVTLNGPATVPETRRFRGYRLDEERRPVFQYELARGDQMVVVTERPVPRLDPPGLTRHLEFAGPPGAMVVVETGAKVGNIVVLGDDGRQEYSVEVTW